MLKSLTGEELRLLPTFYEDRWQPVTQMTGPPSDPQAAFDAVKELCRRARVNVPRWGRWQAGPIGAEPNPRIGCIPNRPCANCLLTRLARRYSVPDSMQAVFDGVFAQRVVTMAEQWS